LKKIWRTRISYSYSLVGIPTSFWGFGAQYDADFLTDTRPLPISNSNSRFRDGTGRDPYLQAGERAQVLDVLDVHIGGTGSGGRGTVGVFRGADSLR